MPAPITAILLMPTETQARSPLWEQCAWQRASFLQRRLRSASPWVMTRQETIQETARRADQDRVRVARLPKALVDSERIITRLRAEGYELARDHRGADLVVVNTCGFLDSAQAESLAAIGKALNENGKVVVTGCMGAEPERLRNFSRRAGRDRTAAIRERGRGGASRGASPPRPVPRSPAA